MFEFGYMQLLSLALFGLMAFLLWYAATASTWTRTAAVVSLAAAAGAFYAMFLAYGGEKGLELERAEHAQKQRGKKDRGGFGDAEREKDAKEADASPKPSGQNEFGSPTQSAPGQSVKDCPECPELVVLEPRYYRMGAAPGDTEAEPVEKPVVLVRVNKKLAISRYEVTVGQYMAFVHEMRREIPRCSGAIDVSDRRMPVTCVSWRDAQAYVAWLRQRTNQSYRLPSEAEREYAARAGSEERYATGAVLAQDTAAAGLAGARPSQVGRFAPNAFGLFDVHGNVAEWVADCWVESLTKLPSDASPASRRDCPQRALRDAAWNEPARAARVSARRPLEPDVRRPGIGFRVARDL